MNLKMLFPALKKLLMKRKKPLKKATTIDVTAGAKNDDKHKEVND